MSSSPLHLSHLAILSQLDSRLSRLDKSIAPLGIRELTRQMGNLDAVLEQLAPGSSTAAPPSSRPQVDRDVSFNTINSTLSHEGIKAPPSSSRLPPSSSTSSSSIAGPSGHSRGVSSGQAFGRLSERSKEPVTPPMSVMDRTRAIPRPDVLPRWQDSSSPTSPAVAAKEDPMSPATGTERAVIERGPDIMGLKEYFGAIKGVVQDLEQLYQGMMEGRGGTREQGVAELVSANGES